jgi:hypothetical protein
VLLNAPSEKDTGKRRAQWKKGNVFQCGYFTNGSRIWIGIDRAICREFFAMDASQQYDSVIVNLKRALDDVFADPRF